MFSFDPVINIIIMCLTCVSYISNIIVTKYTFYPWYDIYHANSWFQVIKKFTAHLLGIQTDYLSITALLYQINYLFP